MMRFILLFISLNALAFSYDFNKDIWNVLIGASYTEAKGYYVLERMCDEAGNRLAGTETNTKAINILSEELKSIGYEPKLESFQMPGWYREDDKVIIKEPFSRELRAFALGFVDTKPGFTAEVTDVGEGSETELNTYDIKGKILLVTDFKSSRSKVAENAYKNGAEAVLFVNNKPGGTVTCGVANFFGSPSPIPAYTISQEEGYWIRRLLQRNVPVKIYIETNSYCTDEPIIENNVVVSLEGRTDKRIVIGAHVDAWDVGNGGTDNGQGTAILFDMANLIKKYSPINECAIDFVWFNAEETGLWGSKAYAEAHKNEKIVTMLNMDMTGTPQGINNFAYDEFKVFFEQILQNIPGYKWEKGVIDHPWTNSDHIFFMRQGIPAFNIMGHLDEEQVKYYHDFGDTFDKQNKRYISDAAGIISSIIYELANTDQIPLIRRTPQEIKEYMQKHNLEEQLKRQGWWNLD